MFTLQLLLFTADEASRLSTDAAQTSADAAWASFWVSAAVGVAAVCAAAFSGFAWRATHRQAKSADAQLKMAQEAERKAEAAKVSAWLVMHNQVAKVYVRNGNGGPVYDARCHVYLKPQEKTEPLINIWEDTWTALSPAVAGVNDDEKAKFDVKGNPYNPEGEWRWEVSSQRFGSLAFISSMSDWTLWDGRDSSHGLGVDLDFRDSAGQRWKRSHGGQLRSLEELAHSATSPS